MIADVSAKRYPKADRSFVCSDGHLYMHILCIYEVSNECVCPTIDWQWAVRWRLLTIRWMFTECSLIVHRIFTECSLNVRWMFADCSLHVRWMFANCSLNVCWYIVYFVYSISIYALQLTANVVHTQHYVTHQCAHIWAQQQHVYNIHHSHNMSTIWAAQADIWCSLYSCNMLTSWW